MHITLFKALKSINLNDDLATAVVELGKFVASEIKDATAGLEAQNKALESKLDGMKTQLTILSFMLGIVSLAALFGPVIAKLA
jgi:hypothetical protein